MKERSFDEMIAYFNRRVADMDISQDCKMELLGMVTALGYKHEKTAQQWIPCSDRLPNCNGIYIATRIMSDGFECRNIVDACYFDGFNTWHDDTRVNHERKYLTDVVAWRELPEPWRGEEHETD